MFDLWGAEDVFGADDGCLPGISWSPYAVEAGGDRADGDSPVGDVWGLAAGALAGVAAYAGVRRLLERSRRGSRGQADAPRPAPPARSDSGTTRTAVTARDETGPAAPRDQEGERAAAQLVDELVALYDLEPSETLKRRIVRSLAKVGVQIDDASGVPFDTERHDVMGTVPAEAGVAPGTVVDVVRPGFARVGGQVVRATEVVVATDVDGAW